MILGVELYEYLCCCKPKLRWLMVLRLYDEGLDLSERRVWIGEIIRVIGILSMLHTNSCVDLELDSEEKYF